jgi:hypothetical protein
MTPENAEILALQGLGWLAGDETGMERFLAASGMDAESLRAAAGTSDMAVALLDFLLANEDLLIRFCEESETAVKRVHMARHVLGGEF